MVNKNNARRSGVNNTKLIRIIHRTKTILTMRGQPVRLKLQVVFALAGFRAVEAKQCRGMQMSFWNEAVLDNSTNRSFRFHSMRNLNEYNVKGFSMADRFTKLQSCFQQSFCIPLSQYITCVSSNMCFTTALVQPASMRLCETMQTRITGSYMRVRVIYI